jgi:hypothetical protein
MTSTFTTLAHLSNESVLEKVQVLVERERYATADLIDLLSELDARRLYLGQGCSSLFTYCTQALRLSEHAAYRRIEAARAARRFPAVLELLNSGAINLTTIGLLTSHLTESNHHDLLKSATHRSKREVEQLIAAMHPQPPTPTIIRKLPMQASRPAQLVEASGPMSAQAIPSPQTPTLPARSPVVVPLSPQRYKLQFTVSRETHDKLRRAQDLLRHTFPNGDPAAIFERALTLLLTTLEKEKLGETARPRRRQSSNDSSRHIPAAIRRQVWHRDDGRCAFVGAIGRCEERGFLEFHHVVPFAAGGNATADNLELRCRAHNAYEAALFFGPLIVREVSPNWR